jgi:hypothetical protein
MLFILKGTPQYFALLNANLSDKCKLKNVFVVRLRNNKTAGCQ